VKRPGPRLKADELHDALMQLGFIRVAEGDGSLARMFR